MRIWCRDVSTVQFSVLFFFFYCYFMHTDLTCKYRVLIWYILCFSFLHLFFRNPLKNYIKLQWPLRLLVNSGSLEGLNFLLYRILRKACQLKKNTSVNSRVIFINRKHQAHLKKKKKVMFIILVHLNIACIESESLSKPPELMKITTS